MILYSQCLTQILSKTSSISYMKEVYEIMSTTLPLKKNGLSSSTETQLLVMLQVFICKSKFHKIVPHQKKRLFVIRTFLVLYHIYNPT